MECHYLSAKKKEKKEGEEKVDCYLKALKGQQNNVKGLQNKWPEIYIEHVVHKWGKTHSTGFKNKF